MKNGQLVKIHGASGIESHFGIVVDTIGEEENGAAFLKVPCKCDRLNSCFCDGLILLGFYYLKNV